MAVAMAWMLLGVHAESTTDSQTARYRHFDSLLGKNDVDGARGYLLEWKSEAPMDVQLAVAWGNYYGNLARQSDPSLYAVSKGTIPGDLPKGVFPLTREGAKEIEGAFDTRPCYDTAILTKTVAVLRDAATTHPERLDIWMGMAHTQLLAQDWDAAFVTLATMTVYAKEHPNGLQFTMDKPIDAPADKYMPEKLHAYVVRAIDAETTGALEFVLRIAQLTQKHYPDSAIGYNDEAFYRYETGSQKEALEALLKAHSADPSDCIIMMNIAAHHVRDGNRSKARELYRQVVDRASDPAVKSDAAEFLEKLTSGNQQ